MEFPWRCNVDTIAMDLKVSWEMSDEIIDDKNKRQADTDGFNAASDQFTDAIAEIEEVESSDSARVESAELMGQQTAAMASIVMAMIVVMILFLIQI